MKMSYFFQPHLRLIYIFLWGFGISTLSYLSLLLGLNIIFCLCFILFLLYFSSNQSGLFYLKRWITVHFFTLLIWLTLTWKIGIEGVEWNDMGIQTALLITLRINLLVFSIWLFLWNITDTILVQAIAKLPLPTKFIYLCVLTVRYITLLDDLHCKMDIAMKARGYNAGFNRRTLKVTAQRVALLLIRAMLKAEMAQIALKCRGFRYGEK